MKKSSYSCCLFQVFSLRAAPGRNSTPTIRGTRVSTVRRSTALRCETSKYWAVCGGFVKYHHPAFSDDRYDLDFELFELLPLVADTAPAARNEILAQWIDGFGQYKTAPGKYEKILTSDSVSNTAPTSDGFGIRQRSAASFRSVWSGCVLPTEPQGTVTCRKRITKPMANGPPIPVSTEKTLLRLVESRLRLSSAHGIPFLEHGRIFLSK